VFKVTVLLFALIPPPPHITAVPTPPKLVTLRCTYFTVLATALCTARPIFSWFTQRASLMMAIPITFNAPIQNIYHALIVDSWIHASIVESLELVVAQISWHSWDSVPFTHKFTSWTNIDIPEFSFLQIYKSKKLHAHQPIKIQQFTKTGPHEFEWFYLLYN
jgi:hypothetical protein